MNSQATTADEYLASLPEWQAKKLQAFRTLIHQSSGDITEEIKWGVPAFIIDLKVTFTMAAFKNHVKYNFILNGALLDDKKKLFNNGLESPKSRGIDLTESQAVDHDALRDLIAQAITADRG